VRRPATLADVEAIVAMGERFRSQTTYADTVEKSPESVRALTTRMVNGDDSIVFVAEDPATGDLVGMLAVLTYTHYMSGVRKAIEVVWWVDPDQRGTLGVRLLRDAETWARARGAEALELIAPTPRIEQLYDRLGYAPVERMYFRRL
jgi:GNAT superfamily N-acetyltransferase